MPEVSENARQLKPHNCRDQSTLSAYFHIITHKISGRWRSTLVGIRASCWQTTTAVGVISGTCRTFAPPTARRGEKVVESIPAPVSAAAAGGARRHGSMIFLPRNTSPTAQLLTTFRKYRLSARRLYCLIVQVVDARSNTYGEKCSRARCHERDAPIGHRATNTANTSRRKSRTGVSAVFVFQCSAKAFVGSKASGRLLFTMSKTAQISFQTRNSIARRDMARRPISSRTYAVFLLERRSTKTIISPCRQQGHYRKAEGELRRYGLVALRRKTAAGLQSSSIVHD